MPGNCPSRWLHMHLYTTHRITQTLSLPCVQLLVVSMDAADRHHHRCVVLRLEMSATTLPIAFDTAETTASSSKALAGKVGAP